MLAHIVFQWQFSSLWGGITAVLVGEYFARATPMAMLLAFERTLRGGWCFSCPRLWAFKTKAFFDGLLVSCLLSWHYCLHPLYNFSQKYPQRRIQYKSDMKLGCPEALFVCSLRTFFRRGISIWELWDPHIEFCSIPSDVIKSLHTLIAACYWKALTSNLHPCFFFYFCLISTGCERYYTAV